MSRRPTNGLVAQSRFIIALVLLSTGALLSLGTSLPPPRMRVPAGVFMNAYSTRLLAAQASEVVVTNYTTYPVRARFLGTAGRTLLVPPGSSEKVCLVPGKYAFELKDDRKVKRRLWVKLAPGRRYLYFHR